MGDEMKKKASLLVIVGILSFVFLVGCPAQIPKDPFLTSSYRALSAMDTTYDAVWSSFVKLYKDGLVKEETFQKGRILANDYFNRWTAAAKYLKRYAAGELGQDGYAALINLANVSLDELKKHLVEK